MLRYSRIPILLILLLFINLAHATSYSPYIDTYNAVNNQGSTSYTITISTATTNELIYLPVTISSNKAGTAGGISISDSAGLTWKSRGFATETSAMSSNAFYAIAPMALHNDVITVTLGAASEEPSTAVAIAIANVNSITPFDPNSAVPQIAGAGAATSVTSAAFSTSNANDMILMTVGTVLAQTSFTTGTIAGSGSILAYSELTAPAQATEYANVLSTQSSQTAAMSWSTSSKQVYMVYPLVLRQTA